MYELAYHLHTDLAEAEVAQRTQDIESVVTKNGGSVALSREAKKTRLSYPIAHQRAAYFGVMDFSGPPEMIEKVNAQLKLQEGLLRYLIVNRPDDKELRTFGDQRARKTRTHTPAPQATAEKAAPVDQQKLEDVLEKI